MDASIGSTDLELFNVAEDPPAKLLPGRAITFVPEA